MSTPPISAASPTKLVPSSAEDAAGRQPPPGEGAVALAPSPAWTDAAAGESPHALPAADRLRQSREDHERFRRLIDARRRIGYGVAITGLGLLVTLGLYSFRHLQDLAGDSYAALPPRSLWLLVGGHAVVTVAFVFLGYQLLRAAERLILPYWWAESNPELARLMLGMGDPISTAVQTTERAVAVVERVADPLIALAQRLSPGQKG